MEVIAIQKSVVINMTKDLQQLLTLTQQELNKYAPVFRQEQWLDNEEVCRMLHISKRSLQSYKDKGLLPCSKLHRKNYYKLSDVQALLNELKPASNDRAIDR